MLGAVCGTVQQSKMDQCEYLYIQFVIFKVVFTKSKVARDNSKKVHYCFVFLKATLTNAISFF